MQPLIKVTDLSMEYGDKKVLENVSLEVYPAEFIAIIGKSGCGKSTFLRLLSGLETAVAGEISQNGQTVQGINSQARIMFQNDRFLPWKKNIGNVGIGLKGEWRKQARQLLKQVGLEGYEEQYPITLSGGQKQRVALARALIHQPEFLLLDEPLGALDALTRMEMQQLIATICREKQVTCMLVTHDVEEAVMLADRVIVLEDGQVKSEWQIDLPHERKRADSKFRNYVEQLLKEILV